METMVFGTTKNGKQVRLYTLENQNGMKMTVTNLGATIVSLLVPDKTGDLQDVVLGYETVAAYEEYGCYFGAAIGRNSNRIQGAKCTIDGVSYLLEANDNENNLHSGSAGFHSAVWKALYSEEDQNMILFTYDSPDGEQGFPGNMSAKISYCLTDDNKLAITYEATTDKKTVANFTNHSYFNLDGYKSGNVEQQSLMINASYYTPVVDAKAIPNGGIESVTGTPMDFRVMKEIGKDINADFKQLQYAGGYDHNYVLDKEGGKMSHAATACAAKTGITMKVYTDCPGMQFYSGNFITPQDGIDGAKYDFRHGFCLETQYFPNSANQQGFESPFLEPGQVYYSKTEYAFFAE
jgi:aldose 1-epimerase